MPAGLYSTPRLYVYRNVRNHLFEVELESMLVIPRGEDQSDIDNVNIINSKGTHSFHHRCHQSFSWTPIDTFISLAIYIQRILHLHHTLCYSCLIEYHPFIDDRSFDQSNIIYLALQA
jgi:hypothetical protein